MNDYKRTRHDDCFDVPPALERCGCTVEEHLSTTIQRIPMYAVGQCRRKATTVLVNRAGLPMKFCTGHAKLAAQGMVSKDGDIMNRPDRANVNAGKADAWYIGEWTAPANG